MKKYFLLLAVVAGMVDGQAQNLLSDCWNKAAFIGSVQKKTRLVQGLGFPLPNRLQTGMGLRLKFKALQEVERS